MRTLFTSLLLMLAMVFALAAISPNAAPVGEVAIAPSFQAPANLEVLGAPAYQTNRTVQELALGPFPFPDRPTCPQKHTCGAGGLTLHMTSTDPPLPAIQLLI